MQVPRARGSEIAALANNVHLCVPRQPANPTQKPGLLLCQICPRLRAHRRNQEWKSSWRASMSKRVFKDGQVFETISTHETLRRKPVLRNSARTGKNELCEEVSKLMKSIGTTLLWTFTSQSAGCHQATNKDIRSDDGHVVRSYADLAAKVAELQFRHNGSVLLFRGQPQDFRYKGKASTLKPSIFRNRKNDERPPKVSVLADRFEHLKKAEAELVALYDDLGKRKIRVQRILRWAILQHYEICDTPLLDVTHSLRVAMSFAGQDNSIGATMFLLSVPMISGAVTISIDAEIQVLRLASICPPAARRPHLQEGYLLGDYPDIEDVQQKQNYAPHENDFGKRLICKFRFNPRDFRNTKDFPMISKSWLYPDAEQDPLKAVAAAISSRIGPKPE
jgi:hypothetical protein